MNITQVVRTIRSLESKIEALETKVEELSRVEALKEKRPYNRKSNTVMVPESVCPSSPMAN